MIGAVPALITGLSIAASADAPPDAALTVSIAPVC